MIDEKQQKPTKSCDRVIEKIRRDRYFQTFFFQHVFNRRQEHRFLETL